MLLNSYIKIIPTCLIFAISGMHSLEASSNDDVLEVMERTVCKPSDVKLSLKENDQNLFGKPKVKSERWLLSLDGGSIRGIMQLDTLAKLEDATGKSITELFDGISGTSIGGILAATLTYEDPSRPGKPMYTPKELYDVFMEKRHEVFQSKWQSFYGIFRTKYKTTGLKNLLEGLLKNSKLDESLKPIVITTQDLHTYKAQFFSSVDEDKFYVKDVVAATASIPTYWKPQSINPIGKPSKEYLCTDGGTCIKNPTFAGLELMKKCYGVEPEKVQILSLGTGADKSIKENSALRRGGILSWLGVVVDVFIGGQESVADRALRFYHGDRYHRFNPEFSNLSDDDASDQNMKDALVANAKMLQDNKEEFEAVVKSLKSRRA